LRLADGCGEIMTYWSLLQRHHDKETCGQELFTAVIEQVIAPFIADDEVLLSKAISCDSPPFERLWLLLQRWGDRLFHTPLGGIVKLVMAELEAVPLARIIVAPLLQRALWLTSFAAVCPNTAAAFDEARFWQTYRQWLQQGLRREVDG